jgi:hypothetical protein
VGDDDLRALFAVALVVLTSAATGAFLALSPQSPQPVLGAAVAALGVGAGIWGVAVWRRR